MLSAIRHLDQARSTRLVSRHLARLICFSSISGKESCKRLGSLKPDDSRSINHVVPSRLGLLPSLATLDFHRDLRDPPRSLDRSRRRRSVELIDSAKGRLSLRKGPLRHCEPSPRFKGN
jgi:hypothetical protein